MSPTRRQLAAILALLPAMMGVAGEVSPGKPVPTPSSPRTYARLVPERKDDFAWENDLVAFRTYGPAIRSPGPRTNDAEDSGIDCWCKRVPYPIIDRWYEGERNGISYHTDQGEGSDFYHVGSSRGCGGTAIWKDGRMWLSGPFRTSRLISADRAKTVFELTYAYEIEGQLIQEVKRITVELGQHLFRSESTFTQDGRPLALDIAIGLTTHGGKAKAAFNRTAGSVSCWEDYPDGGLGTGIKLAPGEVAGMFAYQTPGTSEHHALVITRTDSAGRVVHYAGFGWAKAGTITSREKWDDYLAQFVLPAR